MDKFMVVLAGLAAMSIMGCKSADSSCDTDTFVSKCIESSKGKQRTICTHGEEAIHECSKGYQCKEPDGDANGKGAECVLSNSADESSNGTDKSSNDANK